jgi:Ca2+-transporting ATPase
VGLSIVVLAAVLVRGEPLELMVVTAVSLAVAAVPESLPAVVTLALALGARRMADRSAIVRRLPAVETLGSVTVLATDKTGTLTHARMVVSELWTPQRTVRLDGDGYEPRGAVTSGGAPLQPGSVPDVMDLLQACALCNDASLHPPEVPGERWKGIGDPTEVALLAAAGKLGMSRDGLERDHHRVREVPFDSRSQAMTTVHAVPGDGDALLVVQKGSPEAVLARMPEPSDQAAGRAVLEVAGDYAARGFRVLAVASGLIPAGAPIGSARLRLLGLVAIDDPAKSDALATVRACRAAGITPVLITGDHPATARAVARSVGILDGVEGTPEPVVTGQQIADGSAGDLTAARVFARTSPEQKLAIVQAWQDRGASVAMTGDGVNDGPALRRADVGVAMGHRGTEVARQAADLVLADDEIATIVPAVEEGRRVYANIRRFLVFGLSGGAAEIIVMLAGPFIGLGVPLLAAQILWINLLTHGLTGVAIGAEPADADVMRRPPRPPEQSVLGDGLWQRVLVLAALIAAVTLGVGFWGQQTGRPWQSMVFLTLTALQLGVALGVRPRLLTAQNRFLPIAVVCSALLAAAGTSLPGLRGLLETQPVAAPDAALAFGMVVVGWAAARITHRVGRARASVPPSGPADAIDAAGPSGVAEPSSAASHR